MKVLKGQDILALGFMTFALFVGAGNIIFPPIVGLQAGPNVWMAALGFLITAVGTGLMGNFYAGFHRITWKIHRQFSCQDNVFPNH